MKQFFGFLSVVSLFGASVLSPCQASTVVSLTPQQIHGQTTTPTSSAGLPSTFTTTDQLLTITSLVGGVPGGALSGPAARLGVFGNNNGAINDPTVSFGFGPDNPDGQGLRLAFSTVGLNTSSLAGIGWDFSRADGPNITGQVLDLNFVGSGVFISGFLSDPGAVFTNTVAVQSFDASTGTLRFLLPGAEFGGALRSVAFSNPEASAGQTLNLWVADSDQAGAQFAIRGLSYNVVAIPEPSTYAILGLAGAAIAWRRRRRVK